jgi:hypothetical protein
VLEFLLALTDTFSIGIAFSAVKFVLKASRAAGNVGTVISDMDTYSYD